MKNIIRNIFGWINNYSSSFLVLTAIVGLYFVVQQLNEFNEQSKTLYKQSEILRKTLIQSYRPIGYIMQINENAPDARVLEYPPKGRKDKFTFQYKQSLVNKGSGILVDIGHIYYISRESINFRNKLLNGEYDSTMIHFDGRYDYSRRETLLPKDTTSIIIAFQDIEFANNYIIYILLFYEDQDGNLYDTLNKLNLTFHPTSILANRVKANLKSLYTTNVYHEYSEIEKKHLINTFKNFNHPIWNYFTIKE